MVNGFVNSCNLSVNDFYDFLGRKLRESPYTTEEMHDIGCLTLHSDISYQNFHTLITWPFFEAEQRANMFKPLLLYTDDYHDENLWKRYAILTSDNENVLHGLEYFASNNVTSDEIEFILRASSEMYDENDKPLKMPTFKPKSDTRAFTTPETGTSFPEFNELKPLHVKTPGPYTKKKDFEGFSRSMKEVDQYQYSDAKTKGRVGVETLTIEFDSSPLSNFLKQWSVHDQNYGLGDNDNDLSNNVDDLQIDTDPSPKEIEELHQFVNKHTSLTLQSIYGMYDGEVRLQRLVRRNVEFPTQYTSPMEDKDIIDLVNEITEYDGIQFTKTDVLKYIIDKFENIEENSKRDREEQEESRAMQNMIEQEALFLPAETNERPDEPGSMYPKSEQELGDIDYFYTDGGTFDDIPEVTP